MSGEETERFPIEPEEIRASAKSSDDEWPAPEDHPQQHHADDRAEDADKPDYPPHERHDEPEEDE